MVSETARSPKGLISSAIFQPIGEGVYQLATALLIRSVEVHCWHGWCMGTLCSAPAWLPAVVLAEPAQARCGQSPQRCSWSLLPSRHRRLKTGLSCAALLPDEDATTTSGDLVTGDEVVTAGWYQV